MSLTEAPTLVFHTAYRPYFVSDNVIALSSKFEEVLDTWGELWPGNIVYLAERNTKRYVDMSIERKLGDLPMDTRVIDRSNVSPDMFPKDAVVLAALNGGIPQLGTHVQEPRRKLVYYSDGSPKTEAQIKRIVHRKNPARLARALLYLRGMERRHIVALKSAAGLQSNQYPPLDYFGKWISNAMVYVDTRMREQDVTPESALADRKVRYMAGEPLHLCFSGRLEPLKSPVDVADVARELVDRGVPFRFSVFGDGSSRDDLERRAQELGVSEHVTVEGFKDLRTELLPELQNNVDLFVGTHRQGDTSTTYHETMFAGVPVLSYPNSMVQSLHKHFGVGLIAKASKPEALADEIEKLHNDRARLWELAERDHQWAKTRTMESVYQARVDHLLTFA